MAKMYKFCLQNSIKSKFSQGAAPDPAGGLTAPPRPPAGFCSHESSWPDWLFFGGYGPGIGLSLIKNSLNLSAKATGS